MSCLSSTVSCTCNLLRRSKSVTNYNLTFVRFRKPRWLPKAKSKIFKVREPTPIDPVEAEKMKEWTSHYNTARKSIQLYLVKHHKDIKAKIEGNVEKVEIAFEDIYEQMVAKNTAWNEETAKLRKAEMTSKQEVDVIRKQKYTERDVREMEEIRQEAKKRVFQVQEWKENFVTEENLDDAIEELLNSRADYDFALKPDGTKTISSDVAEHVET